ncbi:hypothetical protein [Nonomuraea cavernae]|uniref:Uncharacterized protein n=1 Tax=Nonomuraea cavernae TaxID=2045107 RepID=A0A917ZIV3_9ACTN|nr:hypothetical protein [Nonomuraea cavernae]MCA2190556.1 hypothetical protein [Nonomuraea cavernae]GGO82622.1 hypothetical protein GCM10012289_74270 [Nonomuraea cavernae]
MTSERPGPQDPDPSRTVRHRWPRPAPPENPGTQRLPYTPDMLPDVPQYETKPSRSGWWWAIVVGGIAVLVAALAVAAILWTRAQADARTPAGPVGAPTGPPRVTDTRAQVSYLLPAGWAKTGDPAFTSGIAHGGTTVVAFRQEGPALSPEQLQARARTVAMETARRLLPAIDSGEETRTRPLELGGLPAATASFRVVFAGAGQDPAYVRLVAVQADGAISYVYGNAEPDGQAARQALDAILDSVTPARTP